MAWHDPQPRDANDFANEFRYEGEVTMFLDWCAATDLISVAIVTAEIVTMLSQSEVRRFVAELEERRRVAKA